MQFATQVTVQAPCQVLWDFLWDVQCLAACLPGCDQVQEVKPGQHYSAVVQERVGPFKVTLPLSIEVLSTEAPTRLVARANGKDGAVQSHVKIELALLLVEHTPEVTTLHIDAEVAVLGKLGVLGHSIILRKGHDIVARFATALQTALHREDS